jgi:hypothetical protein
MRCNRGWIRGWERFTVQNVRPVQSVQCPSGSRQVGPHNADVGGCGLTGCDARYKYESIEACQGACELDSRCKAYTWAPMDGDRNHAGKKVCTLYDRDTHTGTWSPNQIMCKPDTTLAFDKTKCCKVKDAGLVPQAR